MNGFNFDKQLRQREAEQAKRRETARKQLQKKSEEEATAKGRLQELLSLNADRKRAQRIREEAERILDEGAPDGGIKLERILQHSPGSIRPDSDRVILSPDILTELSGYASISFPITFEIYSPVTKRRSHCGVLEFSGEPGQITLPSKALHCLGLKDEAGEMIRIRYKSLPRCTSLSIRVPQATYSLFPDFRSFTESALRSQYATMTTGDELLLGGTVPVIVNACEPDSAVCIVDADVSLDLILVETEMNSALEEWKLGEIGVVRNQRNVSLNTSIRASDGIRLYTRDKGDIFVSFPWTMEANQNSFDFFGPWDDLTNTASVSISVLDLNQRGVSSWPEFLLVGTSCPEDSTNIFSEVIRSSNVSQSSETTLCDICTILVPHASIELHRIHCESRFIFCDKCLKPVKRSLWNSHHHCGECNRPYTEEDSHVELWHSPITCLCGKDVTRATLVSHRSTDCPHRLVNCRFCCCYFPVGNLANMDARDRFMGFVSEHEAACGNRTDQCAICHRRERLKDMEFHIKAFHS
jgi:hypothetical protein